MLVKQGIKYIVAILHEKFTWLLFDSDDAAVCGFQSFVPTSYRLVVGNDRRDHDKHVYVFVSLVFILWSKTWMLNGENGESSSSHNTIKVVITVKNNI